MRRAHLSAGILATIVFLLTGQLMRHHTPPMDTFDDATRLLYRSRHIYLLGSALVNLMLGLYLHRLSGRRSVVQAIGSALLLLSPALLVIAFFVEPSRGFLEGRSWSTPGLYALFAGAMLHLACAIGVPRKSN